MESAVYDAIIDSLWRAWFTAVRCDEFNIIGVGDVERETEGHLSPPPPKNVKNMFRANIVFC